ncbi:MAG TPA: hypothetical protein VGS27_18025 [Candidatus Sulfotelmatobacter sp.]|nr:hypothetical protein [Candidatus Sulfotelmatobacter sp.]
MATLMGGVSRQPYAAAFPQDRFYCLLDELPLHLVPRHSGSSPGVGAELFFNPNCSLLPAQEVPPELATQDLLSGFARQGTIAWVRDEKRKTLLPFWLGPDLENLVRSLSPKKPVPQNVPEQIRAVLAGTGILISKASDSNGAVTSNANLEQARVMFRERGYAPLCSLIHPYHVAALRRYYRHAIRKGMVQLGDDQSRLRYAVHNEPVARFFHHHITATLSAVAGQPLKPSYVYLASYLSGAELKKHKDREQCEFSITLCLDYSPEPELATPWPIRLDTERGQVCVYQGLGDGLAYRGTQLPHYRDKLGPGQTSTSIFFHYVSADFRGPLN